MDLDLLASTAALLLKDALPHLHDLASGTAKKMLETVAGEKAKEVATALGLLKGKVESKRLPKAALEDLADDPQSTDALSALQQQLRKLLEQDAELRAELLTRLEGVEVRVGERGLAVLGNLHAEQVTTGDGNLLIRVVNGNVYVNQPPAPVTADTDLRRRYLDWVLTKTRHVALGAVDPRHTKGRQLSLATIYTALRTKTPRETEKAKREPELMREPAPPYSALEQLDLHSRLVLLGEPGSGKSTFLAFVALCLAAADLELLTSPLPNDDGSEDEQRQPWRHGALLPVRVVLRDFAVKAKAATAQEVWEFIERELAAEDFAAAGPMIKAALERGEALVLFDGLDEVPEALARRDLICRAVERFAERWERSRMVVTSRTYAYQKQKFQLAGFGATSELAPFGPGQIRRFIACWYAERAGVEDWKEPEARARGAQLERAIFASDRIRELAQRPLLLTLMASLHATRGSLPDDREKLYADTVDLLLDVWEERRRPQGVGGESEPSLTAWLGCDRGAVRQAIEELAYEAHAGQPEILGTADLDEDKLVGRLMRWDTKKSDPRELVDYLRDRAGLLEARGVGVYTFPHRTFQEYLAACHLNSARFDPDKVAQLARRDPHRWREVVLLAAAQAGGTSRWALIEELCCKQHDEKCTAEEEWGALLAGQAAAEARDRSQLSESNTRRLERVRGWQVRLLESAVLPAEERVRAGESLARLGDPRFEAALPHLPVGEMAGFVRVPEGRYVLGSASEEVEEIEKHEGWNWPKKTEQPRHSVELAAFYLARYPVTVAQFRAFDGGTFETGDANRPVVEVSWDDAMAYCAWLSERLREMASSRLASASGEAAELWSQIAAGTICATLPTEAQWEAAARGPEGRRYPWGGDPPTPEHANYGASRLSGPTPVGIYPKGRGCFGLDDQAGNVWEWCLDEWDEKAYAGRDGSLNPRRRGTESVARVVRGGAWAFGPGHLRAAYRYIFGSGDRYGYLGFRVVLCPAPEP